MINSEGGFPNFALNRREKYFTSEKPRRLLTSLTLKKEVMKSEAAASSFFSMTYFTGDMPYFALKTLSVWETERWAVFAMSDRVSFS